jgi:two-component system response regulator AtoC
VSTLGEARGAVRARDFDLVLTDVMLGGDSGLDLVRELRADGFEGAITVMTAFGTVESAVTAMRDGADDFVQKPLSMQGLAVRVTKWLEHRELARRAQLYERLEAAKFHEQQPMLGNSPAWRGAIDMADRLARLPLGQAEPGMPSPLPAVLIIGETGTGKGVMARYLHQRASLGDKSRPPFVHVNCSALPATLVEAEVFGHEKGAFTDAKDARPGLFEMADCGTIFLDEIADMPIEMQAKLLLVVEHGTYRRVGGTKERSVRARVIAASNQSLEDRIGAGAFRRDLYYRLSAFTIRLPPLRDREDDAVTIAESLVERAARQFGRAALPVSGAARRAIMMHDWPGNVRELSNAVQRAVMLGEGPELMPVDFGLAEPGPSAPKPVAPAAVAAPVSTGGSLVFDFENGPHTADAVERELIVQALSRTKGNVSAAARLVGMQRSSLRYRIERYGLERFVEEVANP